MKKLFFSLFILALTASLFACGEKDAAKSTKEPSAFASAPAAESQSAGKPDVDMTKLSSTMIYSEVYNMMYAPNNYIGKTVRMNGQFAIYRAADENGAPIPDQIYFACVIADATACCSQGLEFVLAGEHSYPDDYPEVGEEITVTGTFELYTENNLQYCRLRDASLD